MPFFLFIVGVAMALSFRSQNKEGNRLMLLWNCIQRAVRMFLVGLILQGGTYRTTMLSAWLCPFRILFLFLYEFWLLYVILFNVDPFLILCFFCLLGNISLI
jgi:predicted acyltransferase